MRRGFVVAAVALFILSACGDSSEGKFGIELYENACQRCHGSDGGGRGGFPAINVGSNAAALSNEQIEGVIRAGPGVMPSFRSELTGEQVASLVLFVRELQRDSG